MTDKKYLSNEQVIELFEKIKTGDNDAWQKLYENFERYVHSIAKKMLKEFDYNKKSELEEDLFQAGWTGFISAIKNYKSEKSKFTTYVTPYIYGEMCKERALLLNTLGLTEESENLIVKSKAAEMADTDILSLRITKALNIDDKQYYLKEAPAKEKYTADRRALQILDILKIMTDENHTLSKENLVRMLSVYRIAKYNNGVKVEAPNTITSSMENLILELNPPIFNDKNESEYKIYYDGYKENRLKNKKNAEGKAETISNFSYRHLFSNAELDMLIEQVCFSSLIAEEEKEKLIQRLVSTASLYYKTPFWDGQKIKFNPKAVYSRVDSRKPKSKNTIANKLEVLQDALNNLGQVRFKFNHYNAEGQTEATSNYIHELSPYHLVVYHDNFYCIGLKKNDKRIWHYRVDLMSDIEIMKDKNGKIAPIELSEFEGLPIANAFWNPEKYMAEHLYMAYDEPEYISIKIRNTDYTIIHDWFGGNYEKTQYDEGYDIVKVKTSPSMIVHWAMQYADRVEIMNEGIREKIRDEIEKAGRKYQKQFVL